jgi:two-component system heavy metal sensor histidine kinase CusS
VTAHSGSLLRKLQYSFAGVTFVLLGLMALFMDHALHLSLGQENAKVMRAEARALERRMERGLPLPEDLPRLEKAEWRILEPDGRPRVQSFSFGALQIASWPKIDEDPLESTDESGRPCTAMVLSLNHGRVLQLAMDRSHETALFLRFRQRMVLGMVCAVLIAAALGRWVTKRGLAPLARIIAEASDIHPLRLDKRLDPSQFPQELSELVATLNDALDRIQVSFERVSRFSGELAHEMRTPLQNLRAEVESLLLRPKGPEHHQEALGSILEECERLASLIEQTLFLSRTEDPAAAIARKPLELVPLLENLTGFFEASAEEAGVAIRIEVEPGFLVFADESLLQRAVTNLLANALRHAPEGGWIQLSADRTQLQTRITVKDSGPGVPPDLLARLGEPWVKGPQDHLHGLGLAIVKGIMRLHRGRITFASPPDSGLEVSLVFPEQGALGGS